MVSPHDEMGPVSPQRTEVLGKRIERLVQRELDFLNLPDHRLFQSAYYGVDFGDYSSSSVATN